MRKLSEIDWTYDCIKDVETLLVQDKTTNRSNLREKARNYISNYIAEHPDIKDMKGMVDKIADEIEKELKDNSFDNRPPASVAAQIKRNNNEEQHKGFIKLR